MHAEIIAATGDSTGSSTGYGSVNADAYITADLQGSRLPHRGPREPQQMVRESLVRITLPANRASSYARRICESPCGTRGRSPRGLLR